MTGSTQTFPYTSPGPIRLPPGNLETVEEMPGDSDLEDERSDMSDSLSDMALSNIEEEGEDYDDEGEEGSMRERDPVFEKIKETLSKSHQRSESAVSMLSSISDESDGPHVQISEHYTSVPYGIQPRATYEHSSLHADIMGVAYNGRMRMFVILDSKGITTWKRDLVDPRDMSFPQAKDLTPKTFNLNQVNEESTKKKMIKKKSVVTLKQHYFVRRALQYPKYEYRLIMHVVYAPKYNCYFALGKDFSVKVLNRDFEETCSVNTDMRSVLYILFNPVRDELITGGVGGIKIWQFQQAAGKAFTELKPLANYELRIKETLPNVGGSWVKKVELDHHLQHLYCCSDTDLHVYDLTGKLLFKFERAHTMSITGACFSPSAKVLVTSSVDSEVKIWSLNGGLVHTFRGHSRAVTGLLLHPETSSILITSSLDGSIRMWSLDTMDLLYMIVVSADGVMWMGLTDDKLLYISTCRNITLWHLNNFFTFWSLARNQVSSLSLASCQEKTTRVLAVGEDSSVRIFCRSNRKNITTVLPPPDISPLQKVLSVCYSREKNAAFLLITNREIWVYTTRTDPSCRIAIWDVHDLQLPYISGDTSNLPPGVIIQPPSQSVITHRATENGNGNEIISNCCSLCILNSTAMMMTDEGLSCPIRHTYLLLGMEDGRILFMDPVIKGQKYMELKASKDSIQEMRHDVAHSSLITLCRLKTLVMIQIWGLPQLDAMYEVYCGPDVTCYSRVGLSILTGHTSGQVNIHSLEPVEDQGILISKQEPQFESIVDEKRRPEHQGPVVAMDALASLQIYVTCSSDGGIKIWDENKVLLTEVMLEESLSAATFLNEMGDLLVAFKNHIFYIDHSKLCPAFKPPEIEMETSDQESDVYEDPRVLYEMIRDEEEPVTLENYLVPYDHIEFDKDFLEGKTRIEQPKTVAEAMESSETETETDISLAPSSIYLSPAESIESLSMIDLTLGADYSKYDLREQMKATLDYMGTKATERDKWKDMPAARVYLKLRRIQIANAKTSKYVYRKKPRGKKRQKNVTIETLAQSDMEDKEIEMELEKFSLPIFGDSPGGSPSITPPSGQASLRKYDQTEEADELSEEEKIQKKPSGFVPIVPDQALSPVPSEKGSTSTRTLTPESFIIHSLTPSSPTKLRTPSPIKANTYQVSVQAAQSEIQETAAFKPKLPSVTTQHKIVAFQAKTKSKLRTNQQLIGGSHTQQSTANIQKPAAIKPTQKPGQTQQQANKSSLSKSIASNNSEDLDKVVQQFKTVPILSASKLLDTKSSEKMFKPITTPSPSANIPSKPAMNLIKKSQTDLIRERAMQARLPSKSEKKDPTAVNPVAKEHDSKQVMDSDTDGSAVKTKKVSSEFELAMMEFLKSESDDNDDLNKIEMKLEHKLELPVSAEPVREDLESVVEEGNKEEVNEEGEIDQFEFKQEVILKDDEARSGNETEALSDVDSCLATSVGTLSPVKMLDQGNDTKIEADILETSKEEDQVKEYDDNVMDSEHLIKESSGPLDDTEIEESEQAGTPAGKIEKPLAEYQQAEEGAQTKRLKGVKVDVRGLMKKRRITSGRAPSLTRRASADHTHDDHDHDHDHGHDDKRKKDINKKQMKDDRKILPPRTIDREKLMNLPPNPPSMLTRKHSLTDQRKLELNLLHRPDIHRPPEHTDPSLAQVHYDENQPDADQLQEEQWASEAAVHGQPLTLPPQKDKSRARVLDKNDPRSYRNRDRKGLGDDRKNSLEGHTPGVGSSPTAELEKEDTSVGKDENSTVKKHDKATSIVIEGTSDGEQHKSESKDDDMEVINLDTNTPETQMQRTKRLGLKLDSDKVFENDKTEKSNSVPRVLVRRSKLNVYIPQAGADRESISSAKSSRRGTPDSGIDDSVSTLGRQTPQTPRVKLSGDKGQEDDLKLDQELPAPDSSLLSEEDKANAIRRPASSFTGLRRGQLEGERLNAERPHTAHVRFKAEDLQTAFEQALQKYQNLPGTPAVVSADTLYRNDGTKFEDNWQERVIERHTLLRMQKEIRAQSAAQRRQAMEVIQKDKNSAKLFTSRCDSAIGGFTDRDSSIQSVRRANTSMSVPISLSYGVGSVPPPTRDKPRPKTANPALEKQQMTKLELSHEKSFRFRLSNTGQTSPRPESSRSISSVADFSPHWIDPRNPDAWRPKSSRSIPSKCNRYVLVNKPKEKITKPLPSPLEEQLLVERFPKLSAKIVPPVSELTPRMKKSYNLEYSPFVYHRFV
ncbi:uncharacterized protein LOC123529192 isoform X3 [Mercenaria mercenaria]|uniref:uncharacterized protein LOC123529192 isoform X3 n=1 Tax=Mercenaria mercenaria TaxID=6596 RepID=UPI00234F6A6A|nr:uncharacterized protein LOC123529192 isoform X3 [Mercenaria mercenaria]